jgi:integrase
VFLRWCADLELLSDELPDRIDTRDLASDKNRKNIVPTERINEMLEYLSKYEYASRRHITILILAKTGMRVGGLRGLDVGDVDTQRQCLRLRHRPDTETPLKNKIKGERLVAVSDSLLQAVEDYISKNRIEIEDEHGRDPLITTQSGRPHPTWYAKTCYRLTQPCLYGDCPHDRTPNTCDAAIRKADASKCPSSESTHAIRRSVLTEWLRNDISDSAVSGRADVSTSVLESHYDSRKELEKMNQRRNEFDF